MKPMQNYPASKQLNTGSLQHKTDLQSVDWYEFTHEYIWHLLHRKTGKVH